MKDNVRGTFAIEKGFNSPVTKGSKKKITFAKFACTHLAAPDFEAPCFAIFAYLAKLSSDGFKLVEGLIFLNFSESLIRLICGIRAFACCCHSLHIFSHSEVRQKPARGPLNWLFSKDYYLCLLFKIF